MKGEALRDALLDALQGKVLTVAELCLATGATYTSVHSNLSLMRKEGVVDATPDRTCSGPHGYAVKGWFIVEDAK